MVRVSAGTSFVRACVRDGRDRRTHPGRVRTYVRTVARSRGTRRYVRASVSRPSVGTSERTYVRLVCTTPTVHALPSRPIDHPTDRTDRPTDGRTDTGIKETTERPTERTQRTRYETKFQSVGRHLIRSFVRRSVSLRPTSFVRSVRRQSTKSESRSRATDGRMRVIHRICD